MLVRLIIPFTALLSGTCFLLLGIGLLNTLLPIRGGEAGYSGTLLGIITSCYFVGFLLGTFLGPRLIRRIGHIRAFAFCAAIVACCCLLYGLWLNPYVWMLLRVLTGTALVTLYAILESWLNGQSSQEQRGQVFAIYMVANLGSLALSQQLLHLNTDTALTLFALSAIFISIALMPITVTRVVPPEVANAHSMKLRQVYAAAPAACIGALLSGLAMGAFWGLTPLFISQLGLNEGAIANVMTAAIVGGALLQMPIGRYSDNHDRRMVLALVTLAGAIGAGLILVTSGVSTTNMIPLLLASALYGGCAFTIYPLVVAHLIDNLKQEEVLEGSSGLLLVHGLGAAIGPTLAGILMNVWGNIALPVYFCAANGLIAAATYWHVRQRPAPITADEQTAHYVPMVRTTPEVLHLHPDQEEVMPE